MEAWRKKVMATQYQRMMTERWTQCPEVPGQEQWAPTVLVEGNRQRSSRVLQMSRSLPVWTLRVSSRWNFGIERFTGKGLFLTSQASPSPLLLHLPNSPLLDPVGFMLLPPKTTCFSPNKAFLDLLEEELNIFSNADLPSFKGLPVLILCLFFYCLPC